MSEHLDSGALARYEELEPRFRRQALNHLETCSDCRARWLAEEPTRIFALLALEPIPNAQLERLSARVSDAVAGETPARRRGTALRALASIAASTLLAAMVLGYLATRSAEDPTWPSAAPSSALSEREAAPPEGVEVISSPGAAQVLELSVGGTQVVMIFDEAMDI